MTSQEHEIAPESDEESQGQITMTTDSGDASNRFFWACYHGKLSEIATALQDESENDVIDVNHDFRGFTALHVASERGNVSVARLLLRFTTIDVNLPLETDGSCPLLLSCQNGHVDIVNLLLQHPEISVNHARDDGATPLFAACQKGHFPVVTRLLRDPRIAVNLPLGNGITPLIMACFRGHLDVVAALVADPRIDVNASPGGSGNFTPLFVAAAAGNLPMAQTLLACSKTVDTARRVGDGDSEWHNKNAAEIGREYTSRTRFVGESDAQLMVRQTSGRTVGELIEEYDADPAGTKTALRELPGLRGGFIGEVLAMLVFLSDGFVVLRGGGGGGGGGGGAEGDPASRFFRIGALELQMVLCNRLFGCDRAVVSTRDSEPGFQLLARPTSWE